MTIKLVRDKIPALMLKQGRTLNAVHRVEGVVLQSWLQQKLVEEASEACDAVGAEELLAELADVSEVVAALLKTIDKDEHDLAREILAKRDARGAFDQGWVVDFDE